MNISMYLLGAICGRLKKSNTAEGAVKDIVENNRQYFIKNLTKQGFGKAAESLMDVTNDIQFYGEPDRIMATNTPTGDKDVVISVRAFIGSIFYITYYGKNNWTETIVLTGSEWRILQKALPISSTAFWDTLKSFEAIKQRVKDEAMKNCQPPSIEAEIVA